MWKLGVAVAVAALLLVFLGIQFRRHAHADEARPSKAAAAQPLSRAAARRCARQVLNDWVRDGLIGGHYRRACYRTALDTIESGNTRCWANYGGGICDDLLAKLQTSS